MVLALALSFLISSTPADKKGWEGSCPKGGVAVAGGGCLFADKARFRSGHLLVYLHGMAPHPKYIETELSRVVSEARKHDFAVLALLGERGLCDWEDKQNHLCWPTDASNTSSMARIAGRIKKGLAAARKHLGTDPGLPFVAGFSNGGFFTSFLASGSSLKVQGWAVLHAGGLTGLNYDPRKPTPTLLVMATEDKVQFPSMVTLAGALTASDWEPTVSTRSGAHEVRPDDARELLDFCAEQARRTASPMASAGQ